MRSPPMCAPSISAIREGRLDEHLLLQIVARLAPGGWARALRARHERQRELVPDVLAKARVDEVPGPHVSRLFLHPDHRRPVLVRCERLRESVVQRIELLEADDGHVAPAALFPGVGEIEVHLAAAEEDLLHLFGLRVAARDDALELAAL